MGWEAPAAARPVAGHSSARMLFIGMARQSSQLRFELPAGIRAGFFSECDLPRCELRAPVYRRVTFSLSKNLLRLFRPAAVARSPLDLLPPCPTLQYDFV